MIRHEIVDVRYVARVLFLCLTSLNFGNTFGCIWLGILFALYFLVVGVQNTSSRRDFSKRPKFKKLPVYLAIVPLAMYWMITPGVQNGVNPSMVFLPGLYLLFLTALQERSRGNGGFEVFVHFDGLLVLMCSCFQAPHGTFPIVLTGLLLLLVSGSRRGTAFYKYILFLLLFAALGGISYGGWQHWKNNRNGGGGWAAEYEKKNRMMGFDPIASLGSFGESYNSKYNNQVVLRVWDENPPKYMVAARYSTYSVGSWKLPRTPAKTLTPSYYQVDYPVMEVVDSITRQGAERIWVQSTLDNFGFLFAPNGAVGFSAKDIDSLQYFSGGMVTGLNQNGTRSDWNYFVCKNAECPVPSELAQPDSADLHVSRLYESLVDSVVDAMNLRGDSGFVVLEKVNDYFSANFQYSLQIPGLENRRYSSGRIDPLYVFWKNKQGYCEYYASLSVLVLRRMGIPARYVTGFARPEISKGSPYGIYRRKNAHSWVEAYVGNSWYIFDPTPVIVNGKEVEPSWIANFLEGVQARFAKWSHALKEGEWRNALDSWQNYVQTASDSPLTYGIIFLLVLTLVGRRVYVAHRHKPRNISANSALAKEWARKLTQAEYQLSRVELRRDAGETVGHFLARIKKQPLEGKAALARKTLEDYELNRWTL